MKWEAIPDLIDDRHIMFFEVSVFCNSAYKGKLTALNEEEVSDIKKKLED